MLINRQCFTLWSKFNSPETENYRQAIFIVSDQRNEIYFHLNKVKQYREHLRQT